MSSVPRARRSPLRLETHLFRLPPRYLRTMLLRGAALWLLAHLMVAALGALARLQGLQAFAAAALESGGAVIPAWVLIISALLVLVDLHRRQETFLLHNLGVTTASAVLAGSVPAAFMETLLVLAT